MGLPLTGHQLQMGWVKIDSFWPIFQKWCRIWHSYYGRLFRKSDVLYRMLLFSVTLN